MLPPSDILRLEHLARQQGSGIHPDRLEGHWTLQSTWSRSGDRPAPGTDLLLRSLGACLQLAWIDGAFTMINQVNLGSLRLRFQGEARVEGRRPLLLFSFRSVELSCAGITLLHRTIPQPSPQRTPFFALIAMAPDGLWLTARGRGGGLALWQRQAPVHS